MQLALYNALGNKVITKSARPGQAAFVLGLIPLLAFAAVEFLFFIGLMSQRGRDQ
jgi:hypothetical protein